MADATINPDKSYQDVKANLILDGLHHAIDLTRLKYAQKIKKLKSQKETAMAFGLVDCIRDIDTAVEICDSHLLKIKEIEEGIEDENSFLKTMVDSYKRGFSLGVAKHINDIVNDNN